jgi:DNA-directed RNA polymerase subunit H
VKKKKFEVSDHILVPKHEKLSQAKAKELLGRYNIQPQQLPKIHVSDPAIAELDVKVGDIIRVTRKSPTIGEAIYYRVVVLE